MGFESLCGSHIVPPAEALTRFARARLTLESASAADARQVCGPPLDVARRLVALPGSFNPPHRAHQALLRSARDEWHADAAAFVLSVRTVDKERVSGLWLEDRLWLLCELSATETAIVATNRGLYFEQALALRALCPKLQTLAFVAGFDKIVQVFDARYYDDRDAALDQLFARAEFLVAPRGDATTRNLTDLLSRPENARYASRVRALPVAPDLALVSSTRARERGEVADVPELVASFIRESGCYEDPVPAAYAARGAAIRAAARAQGV